MCFIALRATNSNNKYIRTVLHTILSCAAKKYIRKETAGDRREK